MFRSMTGEDNLIQDFWIEIALVEGCWHIRPAKGCGMIPTAGVQRGASLIRFCGLNIFFQEFIILFWDFTEFHPHAGRLAALTLFFLSIPYHLAFDLKGIRRAILSTLFLKYQDLL